jgi:hypothetical protein
VQLRQRSHHRTVAPALTSEGTALRSWSPVGFRVVFSGSERQREGGRRLPRRMNPGVAVRSGTWATCTSSMPAQRRGVSHRRCFGSIEKRRKHHAAQPRRVVRKVRGEWLIQRAGGTWASSSPPKKDSRRGVAKSKQKSKKNCPRRGTMLTPAPGREKRNKWGCGRVEGDAGRGGEGEF